VLDIKRIVERSDSRSGRIFDLTIMSLVVLSLIAFAVDTLPDLSDRSRAWLQYFEILTVTIFTIEYVLRVAVADRKLSFIFSFYGMIDLVAILPFFLTSGLDLRSVRIMRLLRIFRVLKLTRYTHAVDHLLRAWREIREAILVYLLATILIVYLAAVGIYYCENEAQPDKFSSVFHCAWWAIVTLTTVGYGDVYPITLGGRIFTSLLLIVGLGMVAVPSGLLASALTKTENQYESKS